MLLGRCFVAVWEGTDGSGKTTLRLRVESRLKRQGYKVISYKTPSRSPTGVFASRYGNRKDVDPLSRMLLFLANTIEDSAIMHRVIERKRPDFYFIDRYYLCSIIYGVALLKLNGREIGEDVDNVVKRVERLADGRIIKPDLYLVIDVDEEERLRRISAKPSSDKNYEQNSMLQEIVRKLYLEYIEKNVDEAVLIINEHNKLGILAEKLADILIKRREDLLSKKI